ncbi:MAG: ATP-binding protein [Chitinophagaceae bacterium]
MKSGKLIAIVFQQGMVFFPILFYFAVILTFPYVSEYTNGNIKPMQDENYLQNRINELEEENARLRGDFSSRPKGDSVIVPAEMKPFFDMAQQTVSKYFRNLRMDPTKGTIEINDQRYILVRASALSKDFLDTVQNLYADRGEQEALAIGKNFLFDIAHTIGMNDAKNFHAKMSLTDPISKLSAGPVLFAHTGWAFVDISSESIPLPDENFYLFYYHPYSFEADSWVRSGKRSDTPICIMNSGYSSGWCEESFGIPLTAVEVSCIAKGDERCTFIMSPPHKMQEHLKRFHTNSKSNYYKKEQYEVPTFFDRKRVEEEMQKSKILAEESARSKADFVANISHELRTPLGTILGFGDLMKKTGLDATQRDYMDAISTASRSLLSLINNILDLSKIDSGKFNLENVPFNVGEVLRSVQVMFSETAKNKGLKLVILADSTIDYNVTGDPMRLTQVLMNLVGNAIKFTEKGRIEVSCVTESQDEKMAELGFTVKDTGIGIPPGKIETVFERFMQADSNTTRQFGGTGLGLSITKQLLDLFGGSIDVKSEVGRGTEFYFTIHFLKSAGDIAIPGNELQQPLHYNSGKKVLIVEDTLLNQKLTSIILENNGFQSAIAGNGREAIEVLRQKTFDLILMDIQMPEMDGYEATCIIREELQIDTPIIAMTAHALAGEKQKCFQQGINDYLAKPFSENELLFKIAHLIRDNEPGAATAKIVDITFLKKQTRNNTETIREMIRLFTEENPKDISDMEKAIELADFSGIYKMAHSLKSVTGMFGLRSLVSHDLTSIEELSRANLDLDEIKKCFSRIKVVCEQAVKELCKADLL